MLEFSEQIFNALVHDALAYYHLNVSKNLIESQLFLNKENAGFLVLSEILPPYNFTAFLKESGYEFSESTQSEIQDFFYDIQPKLLDDFNNGIRSREIEFTIQNAAKKTFYLKQSFYPRESTKRGIESILM